MSTCAAAVSRRLWFAVATLACIGAGGYAATSTPVRE